VLTEPDEAGPDEPGPDEAGPDEGERLRRWRLLLGSPAEAELGGGGLSAGDADLDGALAALYDGDGDGDGGSGARSPGRGSGLGASAPRVARWLGDIRQYFSSTVVQVMQRDAIDRLNLRQLLLEQEMLENLEPDVHLVGTLLSLQAIMPETTKATARLVVAKVVAEIERRIAARTRAAVTGALNRATRTRRPKPRDIDWNKTIAANLARYVPSQHTVIPERLVGYGRRRQVVARDIVLAIDQSGSMASSVVYASVFGAVLASLRSVRTSVVAFDTSVADLSPLLADPVDVLFGAQLGGGTDINQAVAYCEGLITRPRDTILVLISDLYEGGDAPAMLARLGALRAAGVCVVALLALSDDGAPSYDASHAAALAALGVPAFACTPDAFPGLLAVAIEGGDVGAWAQQEELASQHAARLPRPGCCAGRGPLGALSAGLSEEPLDAWSRRCSDRPVDGGGQGRLRLARAVDAQHQVSALNGVSVTACLGDAGGRGYLRVVAADGRVRRQQATGDQRARLTEAENGDDFGHEVLRSCSPRSAARPSAVSKPSEAADPAAPARPRSPDSLKYSLISFRCRSRSWSKCRSSRAGLSPCAVRYISLMSPSAPDSGSAGAPKSRTSGMSASVG
jgi:hypothetical protein